MTISPDGVSPNSVSPNSVSPSSVIRRGDVLWRETLDAVLVRSPGADEVVKLAGTGLALWAALDEPLSFRDLCADLAAAHDADLEQIAADLTPVLEDLASRGVISASA